MTRRIVTAGVLVGEDGALLIAKRKPGGDLSGKWEFPGGKVEPGEDEKAGLARELAEELSITVSVGDFLCQTDFNHAGTAFRLRAYFVTQTAGDLSLLEHDEIAWVKPPDFSRYDFADSDKTIVESLLKRNSR